MVPMSRASPSRRPAKVPPTGSVPSLAMMVNDWPAEGLNPRLGLSVAPPRFTVPLTES